MTDELDRIHRFESEIEMAGTRAVESPLGVGVLTPELPMRHDSNYFLLDRAENALEAMTEADRVLGGAGVRHRVILVQDEPLGERLLPEFQAAGWGVNRHVFMVWRREPEKPVDLSLVREVTEADLRPGRTEAICSYPWGSEELATQLLDAKVLLADRAETRFFGVEADGEIVSWTDLYLAQGMAQVEDVADERGPPRQGVRHGRGHEGGPGSPHRRRRADLPGCGRRGLAEAPVRAPRLRDRRPPP